MEDKIGVLNQGPVGNQTNYVTIVEGPKTKLVYSSPLPDHSLFQGRKAELEQLYGWLQNGATSMIGVRGEGGVGKSTLAAKVFDDCQGFEGKCWIDVRTGTDIIELTERALQEFGMPPEQMQALNKKDLPQTLLRQLQVGRYLLAIDNLESILSQEGKWLSGYEEFLDRFFESGRKSVLLLAGREYPPKYSGWRPSEWLALEKGLEPAEGAALLAALEAEGEEEERATVSQQVDGNPLALSLLAGWLREEYRKGNRSVQHLAQQSELFQVEGTHRGEKRISVERVFDWSFNRLTPDLQFLLAQVSVLRGAFNLEAATELVQRSVSDTELQDLERRSLLQELKERDKYGLKNYRLLPRIQDFAQKLPEVSYHTHARAISYFQKHCQPEFNASDTLEAASNHLESFYHQICLSDFRAAAQTLSACADFLMERSDYQNLVNHYSKLCNGWQPSSRPEEQQSYAEGCNNLGNAYCALGQYKSAISWYQKSLVIAQKTDNRRKESFALIGLGNTHYALEQYERAIDFYRRASKVIGKTSAPWGKRGKAAVLGGLGNVYESLGKYQQALCLQQLRLKIREIIGDLSGKGAALGSLGNAHYNLEQYEEAITFYQQSLEIAQKIGDLSGKGAALGSLGNAHYNLEQYEEAITFYQQSLEIAQKIGDRSKEVTSLRNLKLAHQALEQVEQATRFEQQELALLESLKLDHAVED